MTHLITRGDEVLELTKAKYITFLLKKEKVPYERKDLNWMFDASTTKDKLAVDDFPNEDTFKMYELIFNDLNPQNAPNPQDVALSFGDNYREQIEQLNANQLDGRNHRVV